MITDGKWRVKVTKVFLERIFLSLVIKQAFNLLDDVKIIEGSNGYNQVPAGTWGHFKIYHYHDDEVILDYDMLGNPEVLRKVVDKIRPEGDGFVGVMMFEGRKFLEFTLTKVL
jgi:hypothetical protein